MGDPEDQDGEPQLTPRMLSWVKNSCLYRLNQKMMSEKQLFDALKKKALSKFEGMTPETAGRLAGHGIAFCHEHKFLDDENFATVKTASGARRGHSRRRIARDLGNKGVDRAIIEEKIEQLDDLQAALNYARKRAFGAFRKVPLDDRRKVKEFSAFARNGFSATIADRVISLSLDEVMELEQSEETGWR